MPFITVPQLRCHQASSKTIRISYTLQGNGARLVALIPGLCTPSTMYWTMADHINDVAPDEYTTVAIDNRGIGESDAPPLAASFSDGLRGRFAYSSEILAQDAWDVLDAVRANRGESTDSAYGSRKPFQPEVGIVGHSMGAMIAQRMVMLRPQSVRFCALLSSHSGGLFNYIPTICSPTIILALLRIVINRFDAGAIALANLDFHFSSAFLEEFISHDVYRRRGLKRGAVAALAAEGRRRFVDALAAGRTGIAKRRRRRDVYFARYMGRDFDWASGAGPEVVRSSSHSGSATHPDSAAGSGHVVEGGPSTTPFASPAKASHPDSSERNETNNLVQNDTSEQPNPGNASRTGPAAADAPPQQPVLQHLATAALHRLWPSEQKKIRTCRRLRVLVVAGMGDHVIPPLCSRSLARGVGATAYVEVPGAHFVFDERAAHVNALVELGLRGAFGTGDQPGSQAGAWAGAGASEPGLDEAFGGDDGPQCRCPWCAENEEPSGATTRRSSSAPWESSEEQNVDVAYDPQQENSRGFVSFRRYLPGNLRHRRP